MSSTAIQNGASLSSWQARSLHRLTLPSGQVVRIRLPGIATLLEHGDLPSDLVDIAILELTEESGAAGAISRQVSDETDQAVALDRLARFGAFQRALVCAAIVAVEEDGEWREVTLTMDDVSDGSLPEDDLAMVAEIVQRLRFHDARGVRVGVEPLDRWSAFRDAHGCPSENCEGCAKLVATLSSSDVGAV